MDNNKINYTLYLADTALILGHRNSEWTAHGPILEQDIAISNIALDLIGQSRNFYQYAAIQINEISSNNKGEQEASEDTLAYLRDAADFKNCILAELPNGDWAQTILRQFLLSAFQYYYYQQLQNSSDTQLAAIAEKSLKEVTYHLRWSSEWVIRLGDGTDESHKRMLKAINELWMYTVELFQPAPYEVQGIQEGFAVDISLIKPMWQQKVQAVFEEATLPSPAYNTLEEFSKQDGKTGIHSEHLEFILAEMQLLQRAYPNSVW